MSANNIRKIERIAKNKVDDLNKNANNNGIKVIDNPIKPSGTNNFLKLYVSIFIIIYKIYFFTMFYILIISSPIITKSKSQGKSTNNQDTPTCPSLHIKFNT